MYSKAQWPIVDQTWCCACPFALLNANTYARMIMIVVVKISASGRYDLHISIGRLFASAHISKIDDFGQFLNFDFVLCDA